MWDTEPAIDLHSGLATSVSSLLMMLLQPLADNVATASRGICSASRAALRLLARDDSLVAEAHPPPPRHHRRPHCERCARWGATSRADVAAVMASLRLDYHNSLPVGADDDMETEEEAWCAEAAAVEELLERKVASEAELREAFYVFDRDEDGFVSAEELWSVLHRLGFPEAEGATREDCRRMIAAHDGDGDGRISFPEFRAMMENAA